MDFRNKTRRRGLATGQLAQRALNTIRRETLHAGGEYWHHEIRPRHFTNAGSREYNYAPRSGEPGSGRAFKGSYTHRKLREFGHTRPLERTGESKAATARATIKATATAKGARVLVRMRAPKLNYKNPKSRIDARAELVRVSVRDRTVLKELTRRTYAVRLKAVQAQSTSQK